MFLRILLALLVAGLAQPAAALTFSFRTGDNATRNQSMAIDSNQCPARGPMAAFVGGLITNTGATPVTNIVATMSGLGNGFALAGGQPATQTVGTLAAGQSTGVYWFVAYGCTDLAVTSPIISVSSSDPLLSAPLTLTGRSAISANAGGQVMSSLLGPGAVVGQTIWFDATYGFGGSVVGDEFFLQPSGGTNFNAACFRLVGSRIMASDITPVPAGTTDRQYFRQTVRQSGSGYQITVRYFFEYECAGSSTTARPYAVQTSGNTNIKYTGNFDGTGSIAISFPGATNPFTIAKTSDVTSVPFGTAATVRYTVTISNPSANPSRVSRIVDTLPAGASFVALDPASGVTAANSSGVPAAGATGTLTFSGQQDISYLLPANGSVSLIYTARLPATQGAHTNSAQGMFGTAATPVATRTVTVLPPPPLSVSKASAGYYDPVNGFTNAKLIPGGYAAYTVTVANPHGYSVTANSVAIIDPTPAGLRLFVADVNGAGSGPVLFANSAGASGLSYTFSGLASQTDDVDFSADGGASWTYVPAADRNGVDARVTHIRIRPRGAMAPASAVQVRFGYLID